jgi:hypothetical protein
MSIGMAIRRLQIQNPGDGYEQTWFETNTDALRVLQTGPSFELFCSKSLLRSRELLRALHGRPWAWEMRSCSW